MDIIPYKPFPVSRSTKIVAILVEHPFVTQKLDAYNKVQFSGNDDRRLPKGTFRDLKV